MAKDKNKDKEKRRAYYDFYNLAKYTGDYSGKDLEDFKYFSKKPIVFVPENEKILIRRVLNPKREFYRVEGPGRHYLTPGLEEYIRVPNPANSIVIDPHQSSESDKKENFTFIPGIVQENGEMSVKTAGDNDALYIDYKAFVRIVDPIQLFNSANVVTNLIKELVTIIREFVASHSKIDIMTNFSKYKIEEFDMNNRLKGFKNKCGLEIEAISVNSVKETDEVIEARNKVAIEKQRLEQARAKRKVKREETKADLERYRALIKMFSNEGLTKEDISFLASMYMKLDSVNALKESDKANVFLSMGEGMNVNPASFFAMQMASRMKKQENSNYDEGFDDDFDDDLDELDDELNDGRTPRR